jgi:hypothetical protein
MDDEIYLGLGGRDDRSRLVDLIYPKRSPLVSVPFAWTPRAIPFRFIEPDNLRLWYLIKYAPN